MLSLVLAATVSGDAVSDQTLRDYRAVTLQGFTVLIAPEIQAQPLIWDRLEWRLEDQLRETRAALPPHALRDLADVRIWVLDAGRNVGDPRAAFYLRQATPGTPRTGVTSRSASRTRSSSTSRSRMSCCTNWPTPSTTVGTA
ncbi:hypothetical protein [Deinococcus soli (ex Cha et al. 2016)]|uniref:hypothetical protein n=1 Tax=Deinococcus soli (ex Cha et al. 2016) TaxID=1309411 RepID=UPI00166E4B49|nr:hypothetical protein [Deinococcus soli (ex Cha et al. 2016)]GGB64254.1 hypothetical protein GCM10008019_20430 [Deinococcus soli (ex Cha et al. 2016)]